MNIAPTAKANPSSRSADSLSALLHLIYRAGTNPECWNDAVAAIAASFGTDKGLLFTPYIAPQHGGIIFPSGISDGTLQLWANRYIEHDIWARGLNSKELWGDGHVWLDEELVAWDEFLQSTFYLEFLSTINIARVCLGTVFGGAPGLPPTSLSVFRGIQDRPFGSEDKEWMRIVVSHVSRSLGVMRRLDVARLQKASILAALDRLNFGVMLLDGEMKVIHINSAAKKALDRNDGLALTQSRLTDRSTASQQEHVSSDEIGLTAWLSDFKCTAAARNQHFLEGYQVTGTEGRSYVVQCSAVAKSKEWEVQDTPVDYVVFVHDPNATLMPSISSLEQMFNLTRTQAKVALALAGSSSYKEVARKMNISIDTLQSHIKEIYPKTKVNRHIDLTRLLLSLARNQV